MRSKKVSTIFGVLALLVALAVIYELSPVRRASRLAERSIPKIRNLLAQDRRFAQLQTYLEGTKNGWCVSIMGDVASEQDLTDVKALVKKTCPDARIDWRLSVKVSPTPK